MEDSSRLIPNLIRHGLEAGTPISSIRPFRGISFTWTTYRSVPRYCAQSDSADYGESLNIGTGRKTTIGEAAAMAKVVHHPRPSGILDARAGMGPSDWYANIEKARQHLGWEPRTTFEKGLQKTMEWYAALPDKPRLPAVVQALRAGYQLQCLRDRGLLRGRPGDSDHVRRLKDTFTKLNIDMRSSS